MPTVLDPECFFNAPAGQPETADWREDSTASSLLATGLLPHPDLPAGVPDTTTLGSFGKRQARKHLVLPVTAPDGDLRLRKYRLSPSLPLQLPFRGGQSIPPNGYEAAIMEGFRRTYRHFMTCNQCRRFVLRLPTTLGENRVRHIVRPTAVYAQILQALSDGRAAKSSLTATEYVSRLPCDAAYGDAARGILAAERGALRAGYVPLFERQADGRNIISDTGPALDILPFSGIDLAIKRVQELSEEDMNRHLALLNRSLTSLEKVA